MQAGRRRARDHVCLLTAENRVRSRAAPMEVLHLRGCGPGVACLEKLSPTRHATERRKPTLDLAGSGP
jgi:hypothetical protein